MKRLTFVAITLSFLFAHTTYAQITTAAPDPLQYIIAPDIPAPYAPVVIEVQGVGTFLGDANITWKKDGVVAKTGVGIRTFSFTAGAIGQPTRIHLDIVSATKGTFSHDFTFLPSVVTLVWEADTSTPPLYKGKSLYTAGSALRIVALPTIVINGRTIPKEELSYQWRNNEDLDNTRSGLGKYVYNYTGDQLQSEENISVDVYYKLSHVGHAELTIPAQDPQVLFYVMDPLRGVLYDRAITTNLELTSKELTLKAEPFFFSNNSKKNKALSYSWFLNTEEATGPKASEGILTLRQTAAGQGSAKIEVSVQNDTLDQFMQAAEAVTQVFFGI